MAARWLGRPVDIKDRAADCKTSTSSAISVFRVQKMADKLHKTVCAFWASATSWEPSSRHDRTRCAVGPWRTQLHPSTVPKVCSLCAGTSHGQPPVFSFRMQGCRGTTCVYLIARCPNCRGPHGARSYQCPKKKEAQERAVGWRGKASMVQLPAQRPTHLNGGQPHYWQAQCKQRKGIRAQWEETMGRMPADTRYRLPPPGPKGHKTASSIVYTIFSQALWFRRP